MRIEDFVNNKDIVISKKQVEFVADGNEFYSDDDRGEEFRTIITDTGYTAYNKITGAKYLVYGMAVVAMCEKTREYKSGWEVREMVVGYEKEEYSHIVRYLEDEVVEIDNETFEDINDQEAFSREVLKL